MRNTAKMEKQRSRQCIDSDLDDVIKRSMTHHGVCRLVIEDAKT